MAFILFKQILVLFLMIGMGWLLVKTKLAKTEDSKILSVICLYLIVPCVVLKSFQIEYSVEIKNGLLLGTATAILIHLIMFLLVGLLRKPLKLTALERISLIYSNAGNLIIPLVTALLGDEWVIYTSSYICVQCFLIFSHGSSVMEGQRGLNWKKIATNVNLICIVIGVFMFAARLSFPAVIQSTLSSVASMIGPVSMIMMGMVMASVNWKQVFSNSRIYMMILLRMIIIPVILTVVLKYSGLSGLVPEGRMILMISLLASITPTASTVNQMAILNNREPDYSAAINVLTTLTCIITMPLIISFYLR